jgi:hypothetical protein
VRLTFLIACLLCFAACEAQSLLKKPISIDRKEGTVAEFLDDLNRIPGITISYSSRVVNLSKKIQLKGEEKTLGDYLQSILQGQAVKFVEQPEKIFVVPDERPKNKFTISGYITDRKNGERMIGASIFIPSPGGGTTSNNYGFFSITLEQDTILLQVSHTSYQSWSAAFFLQTDTVINIALEQSATLNELVIVNAESRQSSYNRTLVGKTDISPAFIKSVSALLSEPDVLKTLQLLPGIQAGSEGMAGLIVRGGSADQNLILLDGAPVYNATHAFGIFSVFNADAVNNVEVLKSGFPASYGGRLSSVVDVHMREGDKYNFHGEGGVGLIFSKFSIEGPIKKGKSSFLVAMRRTYADLFLVPIYKITEPDIFIYPFFTDLNVKANFPVGESDRFYFSFYMGQDKLRVGEKDSQYDDTSTTKSKYDAGFSWGNITAMTRWNHVFNKKLFSNFTLTYSRYRFRTWDIYEEKTDRPNSIYREEVKYFSGIRDVALRADIDYLPAPDHFVKGGISATWHSYRPGVNSFYQRDQAVRIDQVIDNHSLHSGEIDAWIEDDIRINDKMKTNVGARYSAFVLNDVTYSLFQPRVNWLYMPDRKWSIKASASRMNQFIHLLTNNSIGLPTDLWLPVTKQLPPQTSDQLSAGISYDAGQSVKFTMEAFYKKQENLIEQTSGSVFFNAYDNWQEMVETGTGKSYGVEWLAQKKKGRLTGLLSYTLSRSTRRFANINEGKEFPFRYDRRHEVKLAAIWRPSSRFEASMNWFLSSGIAVSLPHTWYYDPVYHTYIDIYESRNNYRMPAFHRLDASIRFTRQKRKHTRIWSFSIYNVYNRLNPLYIEFDGEGSDRSKLKYRAYSIFPVLPSFSYQFKF